MIFKILIEKNGSRRPIRSTGSRSLAYWFSSGLRDAMEFTGGKGTIVVMHMSAEGMIYSEEVDWEHPDFPLEAADVPYKRDGRT